MSVRSVFFDNLTLNGRMLIECESSTGSTSPEQIPPTAMVAKAQQEVVVEISSPDGIGKRQRFPLSPEGEKFLPFSKNVEMKQHIDDSEGTLQVLFILVPVNDKPFDMVMVKQLDGSDPIRDIEDGSTATVYFEQKENAATSSYLSLSIGNIVSDADYTRAFGALPAKAAYVLAKQGNHYVMLENRDVIGFGTPGGDRIKLCNSLSGSNSVRAKFLRVWYSCP